VDKIRQQSRQVFDLPERPLPRRACPAVRVKPYR
jgi:hypothetical protein